MDLAKLTAAKVDLYLGMLRKAWKPTLVGSRAPTDLVPLQPPLGGCKERESHVAASLISPFPGPWRTRMVRAAKGHGELTSRDRIQKFRPLKGK